MAETKHRADGSSTDGKRKKATARAAAERPSTGEEAAAAPKQDHVCNVAFCPIGLALSTVQGAAPDVLEHLLKATQEFLLAARAVIDNRAKDLEGSPGPSTLERIEVT